MAEALGATACEFALPFCEQLQNYEGDHVQSSTRTLLSSSRPNVRQKKMKHFGECVRV